VLRIYGADHKFTEDQKETPVSMDDIAETSPLRGNGPHLSARARRQEWWLKIHRWLGIALLVPMAVLGVTGSAQVWPEETEELLNPQREVAASADPAQIGVQHVTAAREALEEWGPMVSIQIGAQGEPLTAQSAAHSPPLHGIAGPVSQIVYLDPQSAEVIDNAPSSGSFMWYMHFVHGLFLIPDWGRQAVGWMGWFLVISAVTGIVVFWPGTKRVMAALRSRKVEGKMLNIHRQSGFLLSLVLIVEAITGAWISFPQAMAALVEPGVEQPERRRRGGGPQGDPIPVSDAAWIAALEQAQAEFAGRPTAINAPAGESASWSVSLAGDGLDATVTLPLEEGGEIALEEREQRAGPPPPSTRAGAISMVMRQLHYALIGGIVWEVLVFLSGIALTFLSVSGVYVWAKRKLKKKQKVAI